MTIIIPIVVALAIGFIVFGIVGTERAPRDSLETRLAQFGGDRPITLQEAEMSLTFAERIIHPAIDRWTKSLARRSKGDAASQIQEKLNLAGRPWGLTVGGFLALRLIIPPIFFVLFFGLLFALNAKFPISLIIPVALGGFGFMLPEMMVGSKIKGRQTEILLSLPSALDLLTISVEAGLGFDAALGRVVDKYHNALSEEFNQGLNEIRLGKPRAEVLDGMGRRCKVEELNNFVQAIIQSEQLGVGITNVLRIQSEEIRRRRRQKAEEAGQQAPLKMLFPMVGCIFPTIFIVLLGPAALKLHI